jgi:arylformamidase
MGMPLLDISVALSHGQVVWPSERPIGIERRRLLEADGANVSELCMSLHSGTHLDPPLHFVAGGKAADQIPLDVLIGPADVVDLPEVSIVTAADLEGKSLPADCRRLLLRTRNSAYWAAGDTRFHEDYVGLSEDAARWIVGRRIGLVGIDYLSVEPFRLPGHPVHRTLLAGQVIILETIDLSAIAPGRYQLYCLPLLIAGADGAPARAVLQERG